MIFLKKDLYILADFTCVSLYLGKYIWIVASNITLLIVNSDTIHDAMLFDAIGFNC